MIRIADPGVCRIQIFITHSYPCLFSRNLLPDLSQLQPNPGHLHPDSGHLLPGLGYLLPDLGYLLPDLGYLLPDSGHLLPDLGHLLPDPGHLLPDPGHLLRIRVIFSRNPAFRAEIEHSGYRISASTLVKIFNQDNQG